MGFRPVGFLVLPAFGRHFKPIVKGFKVNTNTQNQDQNQIQSVSAKKELGLIVSNMKSGGQVHRTMNRKAFALTSEGAGLKGKALKKAHYNYLARCAKVESTATAALIADGKIKIVGHTCNKARSGGTLRWVDADAFEAKDPGEAKRTSTISEDEALKALASVKGITVDELVAALELAAK